MVGEFKSVGLRKLAMFALKQSPTFLMQVLLDATALPATHSLIRKLGEEILLPLFNLKRTWCYAVHRDILDLLKLKKIQ